MQITARLLVRVPLAWQAMADHTSEHVWLVPSGDPHRLACLRCSAALEVLWTTTGWPRLDLGADSVARCTGSDPRCQALDRGASTWCVLRSASLASTAAVAPPAAGSRVDTGSIRGASRRDQPGDQSGSRRALSTGGLGCNWAEGSVVGTGRSELAHATAASRVTPSRMGSGTPTCRSKTLPP